MRIKIRSYGGLKDTHHQSHETTAKPHRITLTLISNHTDVHSSHQTAQCSCEKKETFRGMFVRWWQLSSSPHNPYTIVDEHHWTGLDHVIDHLRQRS